MGKAALRQIGLAFGVGLERTGVIIRHLAKQFFILSR
jgi:hypothetical protein